MKEMNKDLEACHRGRDGALRRPRRVQRRNVLLCFGCHEVFVQPAERGLGRRSAPSLPNGGSVDAPPFTKSFRFSRNHLP
jgi:hypothetical protein